MAINPHEPTPLELATTEDLVQQLMERYPFVMLVAVKPSRTDGEEDTEYWLQGGHAVLCGMAELAKAKIVSDHLGGRVDDGGEA